MMTPFQIGILVFLGLIFILSVILVWKILKTKESTKVSSEIDKTTLSVQKSAEIVINELNKRVKSAEEHALKLEEKLITAEEIAKSATKAKEDYVRIIKDDKVIYPKYPLIWTAEKEDFTVDYECDVLEVSEKKAKIRPYTASSSNKKWNDLPAEEKTDPNGTFRHVYEKWVPLEKLELIIDLGRN